MEFLFNVSYINNLVLNFVVYKVVNKFSLIICSFSKCFSAV